MLLSTLAHVAQCSLLLFAFVVVVVVVIAMHPQLKCHTTMTMTRSALRIHFINLFLSYERQRRIGKRSTKTKAKC